MSPSPGPPVYTQPQSLATATALYPYSPTDAGDLALQPQDRVQILEYMNADWAKGRNERTGQEGIFPRSYVNIVEEHKSKMMPPALPGRQQSSTGYGNMPMEVAQGGGQQMQQQYQPPSVPGEPNKVNEQGKKFGKKLGNAGE